jgi:hypothetical protein
MNEIVWSSDDRYQYNDCASCGERVENEFWEVGVEKQQPIGGLHVAIFTSYMMFTDLFLDEHDRDKALTKLVFCHDCSVKLVSMLSDEYRQMFHGGHPDDLCAGEPCEYSWNIDQVRNSH